MFGVLADLDWLSVLIAAVASIADAVAINADFPRPLFYGVLSAPYFVLTSVISAVIIVAMR